MYAVIELGQAVQSQEGDTLFIEKLSADEESRLYSIRLSPYPRTA